MVHTFLTSRAQESKEAVPLKKLDKIVREELRINMKTFDAKACLQDLFTNYHTISVKIV